MIRQPVRLALLLGALTALAVSPARADHCSAPCGTTTRTIMVRECVPVNYVEKRTVYKVECREEIVKGFRCEIQKELKKKEITCIERVPTEEWVTRKVCHKETVCVEKEVCQKRWVNVEETVMKKRCVALGHWECRERCSLFAHRNSCDPCAPACREVRTHRVWVYAPQYECCPVKVCKRVCVEEKVKVKVPQCVTTWRDEKVKVCSFKCVEKKRTVEYYECKTVQVPCDVKRTVRVCVPHVVDVNCTRYETRCVAREVTCAAPRCHDACRPSLLDRLHSNRCCNRDACCR